MIDDVRRDVDEARTRLLDHARKMPALRDELVAARETLAWVLAFPEQQENFGFPNAVAMGLQEPVRRTLGTTSRLDYSAIMAALEEDANALAAAYSPEQKKQLGIAGARTPLAEAMWDTEPDMIAWKKAELERAREIARWSPNPNRVAAEAADLRPDPPTVG
jgi:hypothetical protein